jgi:hypothetical protein
VQREESFNVDGPRGCALRKIPNGNVWTGSRFVERQPLQFNFKNIGLILGGLCGFAIVSHFLDMAVGIVFMVFVGSLAGTSYSWKRNLQISAGLIAVAFAFQKLLGLNLPLF